MKLLYIITRSDSIGGASLHVRDLAAAMQHRGHDVHLLVGGTEGPFFPILAKAGLSVTPMPNLVRPVSPWKDIRCIGDLQNQIRVRTPNLVHCHSSKAGILGRYAAHRQKTPAIFSAHGWSFTDGIPSRSAAAYRILERRAATWCDKILCGCHRDREMGLRAGIGDKDKIETLWYGVRDLDEARMAEPAVAPPKMVMVARFEQQKDHGTLIDALGRVKDIPWTIDLVGDGSLLPAMKAKSTHLGLANRINFVGAQPTKEYLLTSQLFLLITNWEGLPLSTLEAMQVGLPLIGTDVGGIPEQISDGQSGYIVPRGDVERLAQRLRVLLADGDLRARFGAAGKARFEADFRFERMIDRVEAVYQRVIDSGHGKT